jgi:glycosyltransferase involved in cell wall biosynthesis
MPENLVGRAPPDRADRRLAIVVTHPIQYLSPVFRRLSRIPGMRLKVFYGSKIGLEPYVDPGFGVALRWDCDLTGGFEHEFLPGSTEVQKTDWYSLAKVEVNDALDKYDPHVVLLHGYAHPLVLRAWRWSRARKRRTIFFGDGNGKTVVQEGVATSAFKKTILRPLIKSSHRIFTLGEANERYWRHRGATSSQLVWVPMLLPMPEVKPRDDEDRQLKRRALRHELGIGNEQVVVTYCGKFQAFKRVMDLVYAVDRCEQIVGLYVGDGPELRRCQEEARTDRHRFLGFGNVSQLSACYAASDMLCHPSSRENYGLVVAEAAACGLPIVATSIVGAIGERSHGRVGQNAETFDPGDVDSLARLLGDLSANSAQRERMGLQSLRISEEMERACYEGVRAELSSCE